ncbi:MAG: hypothetical protein WBH99_11025 [Azovibrio sp.]|uniref:hypothetical protein n=1 Tax=Azovibrio sp. TaxID=1872673 RepID=UPI003C73BBD9
MKSYDTEPQNGTLANRPDALEMGLIGIIEVPAKEVEFVERAYRSSIFWLIGMGVGCLGLVGFGFLA